MSFHSVSSSFFKTPFQASEDMRFFFSIRENGLEYYQLNIWKPGFLSWVRGVGGAKNQIQSQLQQNYFNPVVWQTENL